MRKQEIIIIRVSKELKEKISKEARKEYRSMNKHIEMILEKWSK